MRIPLTMMIGEHSHGHDHNDLGHSHSRSEGFLTSLLHSHSHALGPDSALEASAEGIRAVRISLAGLLLTSALQVAVFAASGSIALLADTVHNFSDALTALPLWIAFALSRRSATRRYTYGYGRAEDLAGVFIVGMVALSSAVALQQAVSRLLHPQVVQHLPWVVLAGLTRFIGNEVVALYRLRVGRRIGSAALVADGLHARTDGLTSLAVVLGGLGVAAGWLWADAVVGILISLVIVWILGRTVRDIYRRLMDAVHPELVDEAEELVASVPGVEQVEELRLRWIGHQLRAEVSIVCDRDRSFPDAHVIATEAEHRLQRRLPRLAEATVHVSPCSHDGPDRHVPGTTGGW